ncbi:COX15/CtaA family protein [Streptomyces sp. 8L]|uniref:COX15/CtaA family protein n=1 Tax=Streptomyces sp. 8L TaxID=2877242 RepID=UPI001CD30835|nr:COX15/CtaA family protein [Streptomyces sp. 8L]MCA1218749.1 COX15/CtaA family protein [Streptomyces sp. 8L]
MNPMPNVTRADVAEAARNPLAYLAARWTPSDRLVRYSLLAAVVTSVVIVVSGGAVRLTSSGLGCPTWPKCSDASLTATPTLGIHGAIEFGNRMLTDVLCVVVGWAIVAARCAKPRRRGVTRLVWSQFWLVVANAVLGGITVLVKLNPWTVAGHLLLAMVFVTVTTMTWLRFREGDLPARPRAPLPLRRLTAWMVVATAVLIAAGTGATGSGIHAGDSNKVPRMPFDWLDTVYVHGGLACLVCVMAAALWIGLHVVDAPRDTRVLARNFLLVLLAQGVVGVIQSATGVPELLVAVHMLGICAVWIGVLRVAVSLRERPLSAPGTPAQSEPPIAATV